MNFIVSQEAENALQDIAKRAGWTLTRSVERAILFAQRSEDFNHFPPTGTGKQSPTTKSASHPTKARSGFFPASMS